MLTIDHVTKSYGSFTALEDIQLTLSPGVYGLLAPNGAGKTTLMQMIVTLTRPTAGEILWDGVPIEALGSEYRARVGYLPQQFGFYKQYNPEQFLHYIGTLKGISKAQLREQIPTLLEEVALFDVRKKKMKQFSGGMIQRVGIAQALLGQPDILVLDEPTAGLDPKERARFRSILTKLARNRIVLISTHIVSDVESIANEIIMIQNKRIRYAHTVPHICQSLQGQVFEMFVPDDRYLSFANEHLIVSERQQTGGMDIRFITTEPVQGAKEVPPQLEDVFLFEYRDEVER